MMKKINRVIVYYDDGTYEEISHSVPHVQSEKNKKDVETTPVTYAMAISKNPCDLNKYSITSMSSGNVDLPKS